VIDLHVCPLLDRSKDPSLHSPLSLQGEGWAGIQQKIYSSLGYGEWERLGEGEQESKVKG